MRTGIALVLLLLFGCACGPKKSIDPATDMVNYDKGDSKMNAAIAEAKKTLPTFIQRLPSVKPGHAMVKWAAPGTLDRTEHIWVGYLTYKDGWFEGQLMNEPEWLPGKKMGDKVRFKDSDASDWTILSEDGSNQEGAYTEKVIQGDIK